MPPVKIYAAVLQVKRHLLLVDKTNQSYGYLTTEPAVSQLQKNRYAKRVNIKTVDVKTDILRYDMERENDMMDRKQLNEKETGRNRNYRNCLKKENRNDPGYRTEKVS